MGEINLNDILSQCFWDYDYSIKDIEDIILSGTKTEKLYLFKKIIINHKFFFKAVKIFSENELKEMLAKIPNGFFKYEFQNIRLISLRNYYLGEENAPKRLRWLLQ
ncbi:MAG: hypothetical protein HQK79_09340 [Desulfobacterales bacterium]|nr:hypothetical protein [Desulfobacterales bacterium]MBF0395191.1 hypothetical protein [Desulfobacterales bacterium]